MLNAQSLFRPILNRTYSAEITGFYRNLQLQRIIKQLPHKPRTNPSAIVQKLLYYNPSPITTAFFKKVKTKV